MSLKWKHVRWGLCLAGGLLLAGCGGIAASPSISPINFLLPGLIHHEPQLESPGDSPLLTNTNQLQLAASSKEKPYHAISISSDL